MSAAPATALILVVDDNEAGRYVSAHALRAAGFDVAEAATGEEALTVAAARRPDLVVLDVNLPDVHGFDVRDRLKSAPVTANVPVVHLSATAVSAQSRIVGLEGGADAYLTAPLSDGELVATVGAVLRLAQAEKAARTAAAAWEMVWDSSATGLALLDVAGRFLRANPALGRLLGVEPADLIGSEMAGLMHPDDAAATMAELRSMAAAGTGVRVERRYRGGDGSYLWTEVITSPVLDPDGSEQRYFVQVLDISARVSADADLLARMKALACLSAVGRDSLAGLSRSELAERTALHLCEAMPFPDDTSATVDLDGAAFDDAIVDPAAAGTAGTAEIRVGGRTRGRVRVSDRRQPPVIGPDEHGLVAAVAEVLALSIERRDAQDALRQSTLGLRALFEASPVAFLASDTEGRVTMWTHAAERMFGWTEQEMLGKPMPFFDRRDTAHRTLVERLLDGVGFAGVEVTRARKDGTPIELSTSAAPVHDADGAITGIIAVDVDITERKRLEVEVRAALDQALQASRLKSQFMANTSHELRTPMTVLQGMVELLAETSLDDAQCHLVEALKGAGARLLTAINDILDFAKVAEGRLDLETVDFEPRPLVEAVGTAAARAAQAKGLDLAWECDADVPAVIWGDAGRVRQVLTILISNAIKFTDHGRIVIRASRPESIEAPSIEAPHIRFTVADSGVGIARSNQSRVFQAFWQVDGSDLRRARAARRIPVVADTSQAR